MPLKCCICDQEIKPNAAGWAHGNNPEPVRNWGRCCDDCDNRVVIPARIVAMYRGD